MRQVLQNVRSGRLRVAELPDPVAQPGQVLIANTCSLISAGTEKMVMDTAKKSLLDKARERPDLVRKVLEKMRAEGVLPAMRRVFQQLDEPIKMGYSSAGVVLACGAGVQAFQPGDRVASNGAHAGIVSVPLHLTAAVPPGVPDEHAAFAVLAAIALQGVRLARPSLGDSVYVIGLGLVGQIAVQLLHASGCRVLGTDLDAVKCALAARNGAAHAWPGLGPKDVHGLTAGLGADAVLITAATPSNQPVELAAEAVRAKGRVVAVGAVGLDLPRRPFYFKEAELVVSCSYGPGRYDPAYEERGHDYPAGHVRWTEQRNLQAVLEAMASGRLDPAPLISHRFPIERAEEAYKLIETGQEPYLGIVLQHPGPEAPRLPRITLGAAAPAPAGTIGVACLGAGAFARGVLLPALRRQAGLVPRLLCSAAGVSALTTGEKLGFESVTADEEEVYRDPAVGAVFVLTRHDQHARQVARALAAGKHVFVEKPLALTVAELGEVEAALAAAGTAGAAGGRLLLTVGYNRRFSPAARRVKEFFARVPGPKTISIRFNAGEIPPEHWTQDEATGGGRIVGEACHAIDLATYLAGAPPVRVFAESIGGPGAPPVRDDQCFLTLRHGDGSASSIAYLAGGDRAFPKERVEVFGGGRVAVIDDFRSVTLVRDGRSRRHGGFGQDKGHDAEIEAFARALSGGGDAPIPWEELRAVTLASILAVQSLREGVPFVVG